MLTTPAVSPVVSVVMVWADTGSTAAAKPLPTAVAHEVAAAEIALGNEAVELLLEHVWAPGGDENSF